jgi:N-acyl-D-amino-acid deacylase
LNRLGPLIQLVATRWDRMYVVGNPPDYEPRAETSVEAIAARTNHSPAEVAYDYLTENAGNFLFFPVTGYARDDHEPIREMLTDPATLLGLGDGGAHVAQIIDASMPSCAVAGDCRGQCERGSKPTPLDTSGMPH